MIRLEDVSKIYRIRRDAVRALNEASLQVKEGEFVVVRGPQRQWEDNTAVHHRRDAPTYEGSGYRGWERHLRDGRTEEGEVQGGEHRFYLSDVSPGTLSQRH